MNETRRVLRGIVVIAAAIWALGDSAAALSSATAGHETPNIAGRVTDARGESLPGVSVMVVGEAGGIVGEVKSTVQGTFQFEGLQDGSYRVDVDLDGFDVIRHNHVRVSRSRTAQITVALPLSIICECIEALGRGVRVVPVAYRERSGQVADAADRPLPHARLDLAAGAVVRGVAYADREGRFRVRVPVDQTWRLTAQDSGFSAVTHQVSGSGGAPLTFRLAATAVAGLPDIEQLRRGCRCASDLFTHSGRRPGRGDGGCAKVSTGAMSQPVTVELLKGFLHAFNRHDLDAIMEYFADDCVFYMPRGAGPRGDRYIGKTDVRAGLAKRFQGIPDVHYGDDHHWAYGDFGVSEWTLTGTAASGKRLEVRGVDLLEFVDGKITRKDSFWKIVE